jgi:phage I-like protein
MTLGIAIINDAPVTLSEDGGVHVSRVQIAKTGKFKDPRYGKFTITTADFDRWQDNFTKLHKANGRLGLPIDVDHMPEKAGDTEAAGWATNLDRMGEDGKTATPKELWATVEWNDLGQELVGNRRYAYLSPSYVHNYEDEEGKKHGTALVGVALTNRPFLSMATVSLSADPRLAFTETVEDDDPSDSHEQMPILSDIKKTLGLPEDADDATVLSALKPQVPFDPSTISLDDLASTQGKVVLSADQVTSLTADAQAGREAAKTLAQMKFDTAWDKALSDGKKVPSEREAFEKLYAVDAETTLSVLASAPVILSTELQGSGGGGGEDGGNVRLAEGSEFTQDSERNKLHQRTLSISAEKNIPYSDALTIAMAA